MKKTLLVLMFVLAVAGFMFGQAWTSPTDVLGAHNNGGRGCAGCHAPHSGAYGGGHSVKSGTDTGSYALWGQDASPLYGATLSMGDNGQFVEVLPSGIATGAEEVGGILLCLSCHDGNLTPTNMMTRSSYEQQIGLLTNTTYGTNPIPTLLGNDGTGGGNYTNDHPVGVNATIRSGNGLVFANNVFTVTSGSAYDQFITNYGWPALAPGNWGSYPYGVNSSGKPYVVCTTCHNQHVMTVYASRAASQIQKDGGGKFYATFFFVNGPYNPNIGAIAQNQAPSTTQFCRQCHFAEANEANNTNNITTKFQ